MASVAALSWLRLSVAFLSCSLKIWKHVVNAAQEYIKWKNSLVILIFMYLNSQLLGTTMAAFSVFLVQNSWHLHTHQLGSQKYDPEEGLGRKYPRNMGVYVLFFGPYLSSDLFLFLVWMQGLAWQWNQAHTRGKNGHTVHLSASASTHLHGCFALPGRYSFSIKLIGRTLDHSLSCRDAADLSHKAGTAGVST